MKTLIAYYSRTGTTKEVAIALATLLKAHRDEIIDSKDRSGMLGYATACKDTLTRNHTEIRCKKSAKDYDLLVLGTPVWVGTMPPAIRTYILAHKKDVKDTAFFCTQGSSSTQRCMADMGKLIGKSPKATLQLATREVRANTYLKKLAEFANVLKR